MPINDKYIIDIAKGNVDSFKRFYTVLFPVLSVYAYRLVRNETEARDIVQESMIIYWEKRVQFDNVDSAKAFSTRLPETGA